ncbi:putative holin-like toxin [Lachnospiraceae bacterium KK002]
MSTYEVLSLLILGGTFLVSLLAYIDRNNKRK